MGCNAHELEIEVAIAVADTVTLYQPLPTFVIVGLTLVVPVLDTSPVDKLNVAHWSTPNGVDPGISDTKLYSAALAYTLSVYIIPDTQVAFC